MATQFQTEHGGAALAQIFIVPAMLVICAIAMGIVRVVVS